MNIRIFLSKPQVVLTTELPLSGHCRDLLHASSSETWWTRFVKVPDRDAARAPAPGGDATSAPAAPVRRLPPALSASCTAPIAGWRSTAKSSALASDAGTATAAAHSWSLWRLHLYLLAALTACPGVAYPNLREREVTRVLLPRQVPPQARPSSPTWLGRPGFRCLRHRSPRRPLSSPDREDEEPRFDTYLMDQVRLQQSQGPNGHETPLRRSTEGLFARLGSKPLPAPSGLSE